MNSLKYFSSNAASSGDNVEPIASLKSCVGELFASSTAGDVAGVSLVDSGVADAVCSRSELWSSQGCLREDLVTVVVFPLAGWLTSGC